MTTEDVMKLPAGEKLDTNCHLALGWPIQRYAGNPLHWKAQPFSTDPAFSVLLEDRLHAMGWRFHADGVGTPQVTEVWPEDLRVREYPVAVATAQ